MARLFQSLSGRTQARRGVVGAALTLGLAALCSCASPTENELPNEDLGGASGVAGSGQTSAGSSFAGALPSQAGASNAGANGLAGASNSAGATNDSAGAASHGGASSAGSANGGSGSANGGAPGSAGAGVAGQAAAGAPSAGATGGGSCAATYSSSACLNMSVGTKVSSAGHNWTCSNDNCRNCDNHPECAPGMSSCPWGAVWTDNGSCG